MMGVDGLPSIDAFVASLNGAEGSAGAVAALVAGLAADLAAQVARQSPEWIERDDAALHARMIREHASALAGDVDRMFTRALAGLARASAPGEDAGRGEAAGRNLDTRRSEDAARGERLGDALIDIVAILLSIGEAAADAAELAHRVAVSGSVTLRATAVAAAMLATGAAEAAAHLVEVNLLVRPGDPASATARDYVAAATASRDAAAALPR